VEQITSVFLNAQQPMTTKVVNFGNCSNKSNWKYYMLPRLHQ